MAVLEKIRVKWGLAISIIIALSLLSFIIDPQQVMSAWQSISSKNDVGSIAGKRISFADFDNEFQKYSNLNGSVQSEEAQKQMRDEVWSDFICKYLVNKNAKDAGIRVGEAEMLDLINGENISPLLLQDPMFLDENGQFSKDAVLALKDMANEDNTGMYSTYKNLLQNAIYNNQIQTKYNALFAATAGHNALTLKDAVAENNLSVNVDYVTCYYPMQKDTTITVSQSEIKAYYNAHKKFFKQVANRDIEYVVFEAVPSESDYAKAEEKFNDAYAEFAGVENIKNFILKNSDRQYNEYWYKAEELTTISSELVDFVKTAAVGEISPVIKNGNTIIAAKIVDKANKPDNITVKAMLTNGSDEITDELLQNLELTQPMTMTQANMIPGLEVLFDAAIGKPQIVYTTQYGNILAEVVEKSEPVEKAQVAILEKNATVSSETTNIYYSKANTFASIAGHSVEGYQKALDSLKIYSHPMRITEATEVYGTIDNAKAITRWAFDSKAGKVSEIITVGQNYFFVVALKDINKEGYAPIEKVSSAIEDQLYNEKLMAKVKADFAAQAEGLSSLEEIAEKTGGNLESRTDMTFSTIRPTVEPALAGAIMASEDNKIYGPVAGDMGVYFFKVSSRENGSFYTEDDANNFAAQMAQYNTQMIIPTMMEIADVKDNRARFY